MDREALPAGRAGGVEVLSATRTPASGPTEQRVTVREAPLGRLNTFGIAAVARMLVHVRSSEGLRRWREDQPDEQPLVLGGGSNLLLTVPRLERVVLRIELAGRTILGPEGDHVLVEAAAGEGWHDFVCWTLGHGLSGLENLSLIPGTVGAAPVQNIGAYGVELERTCEAVEVFDLASGRLRWMSRAECAFGYRDSVFKRSTPDREVITRVRFRLSRRFEPVLGYGELRAELARAGVETPTARDVSNAVCAIRRRKLPDPAVLGNAGSFFKNPVVDSTIADRLSDAHPDCPRYPGPDGRVKLAAGWLIERAGWKGHRRGAAGVHAQHALVLVNFGGATGAELWRLACDIRDDVATKFGVVLEPEPRVVSG